MADDNKVQALLTELAGAKILEEILQKTISTLTEKDYRALADRLIEKAKSAPSLDWGEEEKIRRVFWASDAAKAMLSKLEPEILDKVKSSIASKMDRIAAEIRSTWMRPVLDQIRARFQEWMSQQYQQ
jgi:hypothetical protein